MLSKEDNELVTNTDKGTPMGEYFRRFWIPVALSEELPGPLPRTSRSHRHETSPVIAGRIVPRR